MPSEPPFVTIRVLPTQQVQLESNIKHPYGKAVMLWMLEVAKQILLTRAPDQQQILPADGSLAQALRQKDKG